MKRKIFIIPLTLFLMLIFAVPAFAQGPGEGRIIFGENYALEAEEKVDGDLVIFGGDVTTGKSSEVKGNLTVAGGNARINGDIDGDVFVAGGNVNINGTIDGDIGVLGGNVDLGELAVVKGNIDLIGGHFDKAEGAVVEGKVDGVNNFERHFDPDKFSNYDGSWYTSPDTSGWGGPFYWMAKVVSDVVWTISLLIVLAIITWLVTIFMPEQMMTVRQTITDSTSLSFGVGLISTLVTVVSFVLVLTICLAFIPIGASVLIGIASLFGWIVIGQILGERLLVANGQTQPGLALSSVVGGSVLTLIAHMPVIGQIPCIGWALGFAGWVMGMVAFSTGLGAVLLTRFGTRSHTPTGYTYTGSPSPSPSPVRQHRDPNSAEAELNAKIKAALAEADKAEQELAALKSDDEDTPVDDPNKDKPGGKKSKDEPEDDLEPEA